MSNGGAIFQQIVALAEIRRHLPGLCKRLATMENTSGIPLKDALFMISYLSIPPTISVSTKSLSDTSRDSSCLDLGQPPQAGDRDGMQPGWIEVILYWGGRSSLTLGQSIPPNVELFTMYFNYAGDTEFDDAHLLHRKPAQDEKGRSLLFVVDEVDRFVMDARKHFRPPAPGDEGSPRTIYDYIEAKVAADPGAMSWLGYQRCTATDVKMQ